MKRAAFFSFALLIFGLVLAGRPDYASGPVTPPFNPLFGNGAPGSGVATNQLYFDTSASPYQGYVYDRQAASWQQFGGGGGGGGGCGNGTLCDSVVFSGAYSSPDHADIQSLDGTFGNNGNTLKIYAGKGDGAGAGGDVFIASGTSPAGTAGQILIQAGSTNGGDAAGDSVEIDGSIGNSGDGGDVVISGGEAINHAGNVDLSGGLTFAGGTPVGGDVNISGGAGLGPLGDVNITGAAISFVGTNFDTTLTNMNLSIGSVLKINTVSAVNCSGTPTSSFHAIDGIVTHC